MKCKYADSKVTFPRTYLLTHKQNEPVAGSYTKAPETSGIVLSKTLHCCSILNIRDVQSLEGKISRKPEAVCK